MWISKIDKSFTKITKRKRRAKLIKLEMRRILLQQILAKIQPLAATKLLAESKSQNQPFPLSGCF